MTAVAVRTGRSVAISRYGLLVLIGYAFLGLNGSGSAKYSQEN
ncbi:hypothetical protein JCM19236_5887 [Vibrio sp. JCM 19236]|nr:hypothetical protein JCM19236_5887 [Vibrio sp. JCM 19236]